MSDVSRALLFLVSCVFTQNVIFARLLVSRSAVESRRIGAAAGLGLFTAVVMALSSVLAWILYSWILKPLHAESLYLVAFVLVIAACTQLVALCLGKIRPALAEGLGNCLALVAANCAVLGIALLNVEMGCGIGQAFLNGLFSGLGYLVALVCMAGVQERLEYSKIPAPLKGLPISLISASLMALAFMGFAGMA